MANRLELREDVGNYSELELVTPVTVISSRCNDRVSLFKSTSEVIEADK